MSVRDSGLALILAAAVVALAIGGIAAGTDKEEIQQQAAEAEAYCEQVYGDGSVYNAMVTGGHGGLHCIENEHGPHLHEIPEEYQHEAYNASLNGTSLGWDVSDAAAHAAEKPDEIPLLGLYWQDLVVFLEIALAIVVVTTASAVYQRKRGEQ